MNQETEPMFQLRLAVSLNGVKLQYRAKWVSFNSWGDMSKIHDWSGWEDVPTVSVPEEK